MNRARKKKHEQRADTLRRSIHLAFGKAKPAASTSKIDKPSDAWLNSMTALMKMVPLIIPIIIFYSHVATDMLMNHELPQEVKTSTMNHMWQQLEESGTVSAVLVKDGPLAPYALILGSRLKDSEALKDRDRINFFEDKSGVGTTF